MPRFRSITLAVALVSSLLVTNAAAQDAPAPAPEVPSKARATAETHYQTAVRLYGEGRYREALDEFDAAIAKSPESIFYCNRAVALIKLQEPEEALESLQTCQSTHTGDKAELASIDAQRSGVAVMVDHVQPGVLETVSAINAPTLVAPEAPRRGWTRLETGILLIGIGGASLASAATLDFLSQELRDQLEAASSVSLDGTEGFQEERTRYDELRQRYVRRQRIWLGLTAGGAAITLTGAILVTSRLVSRSRKVEVGVGPGGANIQVRLQF